MSCDATYGLDPAPALCSLPLHALLHGLPRHGVVGGCGHHAAYLSFSPDPHDVVALVGPDAVRLPIAVQVPVLPELVKGDTATIGAGRLGVGRWTWRAARWWDPRPRIDPAALAVAAGRLDALAAPLTSARIGVDVCLAWRAAVRLARGDAVPAAALLGAGPGFTPAGDDVVAGALAVLSLTGDLDIVQRDVVLHASADRTTAVSAALLASAARGEVLPQAATLLQLLCAAADDDVVEAAADALCGIGATSGAALLFGMAHALGVATTVAVGTPRPMTTTKTETT